MASAMWLAIKRNVDAAVATAEIHMNGVMLLDAAATATVHRISNAKTHNALIPASTKILAQRELNVARKTTCQCADAQPA